MMDDLPEPNPADDPDPRAALSMASFDAMPAAFRAFLSDYPRTADARQLMIVLHQCDWQVDRAMQMVRELLPVRA